MPETNLQPTAFGIADSVSDALRQLWNDARTTFAHTLETLEVPTSDVTQAVLLFSRQSADADALVNEIAAGTRDEGEFAFLTARKGAQVSVLAIPARNLTPSNVHLAPYVEIHSRLTAWWLTVAWRSAELSRSTWALGDQYCLVAAAACARALLETAAAFWCDAQKLAAVWGTIKGGGGQADSAWEDWHKLAVWLWHTQYGAKFDERAPDWAKVWSALTRTNVLSQLEKLAKACPRGRLQESYQLLCNTAHPSVGGTFVFSSPIMAHETNTHAFVWYGPVATHVESAGTHRAERNIQEAVIRSAAIAVRVISTVLNETLGLIDDLGLTTRAPRLATFDYWRKLSIATPRQLCPCRSGRRAKDCSHRWGDPSPTMTTVFEWSDGLS